MCVCVCLLLFYLCVEFHVVWFFPSSSSASVSLYLTCTVSWFAFICVCVCVALCVFVILGFSAWLRLWLYFGSPISVARSALWGPWAKTKDILIKMLTVSLALSFPLALSLSLSLFFCISPPFKRPPSFYCLPHNLNPLMPLWFSFSVKLFMKLKNFFNKCA